GFSPKLAGVFLLIPHEVAGGMMVFSACFLISSGMQLMLTRPIETRGVYVIGISTLLALSENVFPNYFTHLTPVAHSLTASPLAFGLMAALALTLLFRFGTRQRESLVCDGKDKAFAEVVPFLQRTAAKWKIAQHATERCTKDIEAILVFLRDHGLQPGIFSVAYDGSELRTDLTYAGAHPAPVHRKVATPVSSDTDEFIN